MKQDIPMHIWDFWTRAMEKLDTNGDLYQPIPEILRELCEFFRFGFTFVYQADHTGRFSLRDYYAVYQNSRRLNSFDAAEALGAENARTLAERKSVVFNSRTEKDPLETGLSNLLGANTLILIPILDAGGRLIALVGAADRRGQTRQEMVDIAYSYSILRVIANYIKLQLYQVRVESTEQSLRSIMDNMGIDVYVTDFYTHEVLYINRSMAALYGGADNVLGKTCWQALYQDNNNPCDTCPQDKLVDRAGNPTGVYSRDYQRPVDGAWFRVFSAAFPWVDGRLAHVASSVDITENKRNEELIRRMALYDALTGLPNRRKLLQDWDRLLRDPSPGAREGYLLFFDLDGFKLVNDNLGHAGGDELLKEIARFLDRNPLTAGRCYRHAGDEFVVLCPSEPPVAVKETVESLLERFSKPWDVEGASTECRASIGIAAAPQDAVSAADLLRCADNAMYQAKKNSGSACFYNGGRYCSPEEYFTKRSVFSKRR